MGIKFRHDAKKEIFILNYSCFLRLNLIHVCEDYQLEIWLREKALTTAWFCHTVCCPLTPKFLMSDLCRWYCFTAHFSHNQLLAYLAEQIPLPLNPDQMIPANTQTHHCGLHYSMILHSTILFLLLAFINKLLFWFRSSSSLSRRMWYLQWMFLWFHFSSYLWTHHNCRDLLENCLCPSSFSHSTIKSRWDYKVLSKKKKSLSKYLLPKQPFYLSFRNRKQIIALQGSSGLWTASKPCCPACSNTLVMPAYTINEVANRDTKGWLLNKKGENTANPN